jgi:hypothetical protein
MDRSKRIVLLVGVVVIGLVFVPIYTKLLFDIQEAKGELAKSNENTIELQRREKERVAEFIKNTGVQASTCGEILKLRKQGVVVFDEVTGKYRKATGGENKSNLYFIDGHFLA